MNDMNETITNQKDTLLELESLKEEMAALKRDLDKEQIVNAGMLRAIMRQRSSWLNKFVKFESWILIPLYLFFAVMCHYFHMSQWYAIVFLVLGGIDNVVDYRTYIIPAKLLSTCSMLEIRKKLIRQKKERFIQLCISLPLALIWVVALTLGMQNAKALGESGSIWLNEGTVIGGAIGGLIGLIIVLVLHRKAQKTNDRILLDIEADEE